MTVVPFLVQFRDPSDKQHLLIDHLSCFEIKHSRKKKTSYVHIHDTNEGIYHRYELKGDNFDFEDEYLVYRHALVELTHHYIIDWEEYEDTILFKNWKKNKASMPSIVWEEASHKEIERDGVKMTQSTPAHFAIDVRRVNTNDLETFFKPLGVFRIGL